MKILIIAAMRKELELVLHQMAECKEIETPFLKYYQGVIGSHTVSACQCGIGKVNAALNAQILIEALKPDLVINSGVAGGLDASMKIGDILVANRICYHDVWCGPGTQVGQADDCPLYFEPRHEEILIMEQLAKQPDSRIKFGLLCSGDKFISKSEEVNEIKRNFVDALGCDMESAAIAQACYKRGVPFMAVRVMSDMPGGGENISEYQNFWAEAPCKTFEIVKDLINKLP